MSGRVKPKAGLELRLSGAEYKYGAGPLLGRITEVIQEAQFDGERWWLLRAECRPANPGGFIGPHERELYVIASAILRASQRRG